MQPDNRKFLWDAREAGRRIERFVAGRTFDDYIADDLLRSAVERQFEILGEALGRVRREAPDVAARISGIDRIVAFRNVIAHGYAAIDDRLVWSVAATRLVPLLHELDGLLEDR